MCFVLKISGQDRDEASYRKTDERSSQEDKQATSQ